MSVFVRQISSSIIIEASPEQVWHVLTDFAKYQAWNPFIIAVTGKPQRGEQLTITIKQQGQNPMNFHPTILVCDASRELRWLGKLFVPRLFDGEHSFMLDVLSDGQVRFTQAETFRGLLVPLLGSVIRATEERFHEANLALAQQVAHCATE